MNQSDIRQWIQENMFNYLFQLTITVDPGAFWWFLNEINKTIHLFSKVKESKC